MFALAGTRRWDGWCHNQRYLFHLVPLFAFSLAFVIERASLSWRLPAGGATAAMLFALAPLLQHSTSPFSQLCLLYVPLALAGVATGLSIAFHWRPHLRAVVADSLGLALGWAVAVHLGDDLSAARALRSANLRRLDTVGALLPNGPTALFAHQPVALSPLLLENDPIIANTSVDQGEDAPRLVTEPLAMGRWVFALTPGMSERERGAVTRGHQVRVKLGYGTLLIELGPLLAPPTERTP